MGRLTKVNILTFLRAESRGLILTLFVTAVPIYGDIATESVLSFYVARVRADLTSVRTKPSYRALSVEERTPPAAHHPSWLQSLLPSIVP
jgi:hypothetical protein